MTQQRLLRCTPDTCSRQRQDLLDGEYADCEAALGHRGLVELIALVDYYATLALQLRVFRVEAPETSATP